MALNRGEIDLARSRKEQATVDLANKALDAEDFFGVPVEYMAADGSFTFKTDPLVSVSDEAHEAAVARFLREFKQLIDFIGEVPEDYLPDSVGDQAAPDVAHTIVDASLDAKD